MTPTPATLPGNAPVRPARSQADWGTASETGQAFHEMVDKGPDGAVDAATKKRPHGDRRAEPATERDENRQDSSPVPLAPTAPLRDRLPLLASLQHLSGMAPETGQAMEPSAESGETDAEPRPDMVGRKQARQVGDRNDVLRSASGRSARPAKDGSGIAPDEAAGRGKAPARIQAEPLGQAGGVAVAATSARDPGWTSQALKGAAHAQAETRLRAGSQSGAPSEASPATRRQESTSGRSPTAQAGRPGGMAGGQALPETNTDGAEAESAPLGNGAPSKASARGGREGAASANQGSAPPLRVKEPGADDMPRTVTVTASQSFVAPATAALSQTAAGLVSAIAADNTFRQTASALLLPGAVAVQSQVLKLELHPAELGSVTASLHLAGQQLSVEIRPETYEAYRRLSADSDEIARSLKRLGLEVETVTVLQPHAAPTHVGTAQPASTSIPPPGREQASTHAGGTGSNGEGAGQNQSGRNQNAGPRQGAYDAPAPGIRAGSALYI
jgi:chemotaxis protein MotD